MSKKREKLQTALYWYITSTLSYLLSVREFCESISKWMGARKIELNTLRDIKSRSDTGKSKMILKSASSRRAELEKELADVLKDTLGGLEKLDRFLNAVERLAVTSLHVFNENQVVHLPQDIRLDTIQVCITAARLACPLLLEFKRDASVFFLPKLHNVEVLAYQLDRYIQTTQKICDKFEKSHLSQRMTTNVDLDVDLAEDDAERMLCHINQLEEIRTDQHFRTVFLFQEVSCCRFIGEFNKRQLKMLQFLKVLEESAGKLDRMNKGAKISSVAGSSVGVVGGILSIIGLALIPVTAGVSFALTMTGVGLGIGSGLNSAVTTVTELGVNRTYQKKASEAFQIFMEDVQSLQECLEEASCQIVTKTEASKKDVAVGVSKVLCNVGGVGKNIGSVVDAASAMKMLQNDKVIASASKVVAQEGKVLCNVPRLASDIPDIGQAVVKGPLALTKSARAGFIVLNALFIGMDIFFICKDSISLAKGSETEVSQFIRARAALWSSEMDSWQKIFNSLCQGLLTSEKNQAILKTPFELEMQIKKDKKQNWNFHLMK